MFPRPSARLALVTLLSAFVVSGTADAQTPRIYCPTGSLNCFGLKYEIAPYSDVTFPWITNRFSFWLQNLQGSYHQSGSDPDYFSFFGLARDNPEYTEKFLSVVTDIPPGKPEGTTVVGNAVGWHLDGCINVVCTQMNWFWFGSEGLYGCALYPGGLDAFQWQTCGSGGWVRFDAYLGFEGCCSTPLPSEVTLDDFEFYVGFANGGQCGLFGENANLSVRHPTCANYEYALTPEPSAVVLLGSVLGGLGIAGAFRRRRGRGSRRPRDG